MMNKLLMKIKHGILLPIIAGIALSSTTPAAAYSYDYNSLIKKIIALLMPILKHQNSNRAAFSQYVHTAQQANKSSKNRVVESAPNMSAVIYKPIELVKPELKPIAAQAHVMQAAPAAVHHEAHDELLVTCLDKLHTCVKNTYACKQQFLNANVTRSYHEFKREFDANLAALHVIADMIAQKQSAGEQFKTLGHIVKELIQTQALMCDVLNNNYGSGMALGLSLAKIEQPTANARAKVTTLAAHLHKALRGKTHTLKKLKTLATDIHALLAPPKEQGLSVMTLWGICNKRV